jgi:hypothetical protein
MSSIDDIPFDSGETEPGTPIDTRVDTGEESAKRSQATILVDAVKEAGVLFFHSPSRVAYATAGIDGHTETWSIKSPDFGLFLRQKFYELTGRAPSNQAISDARATLEAFAIFKGEEHEVHTRIAGHDGAVYIDLCDRTWNVVQVTVNGWRVVNQVPVKFARRRGMLPLPIPVKGGHVNELRALLNAERDDDWALILAWLIGALSPTGPFAILAFLAEFGGGKSTVAAMLRALVDPNAAPIRSEPKDARDMFIAATNGWVIALDNLSHIPPWLSDVLCRLATGGGFATRELHTDGEEKIFYAQRPIILTGIEDVVTRSDLLSRTMIVRLQPISEERRRAEKDLWREFNQAAPRILGSLLDAVSCALGRMPEMTHKKLPRMADFYRWVAAAEPALDLPEGAFRRAYTDNGAAGHELALEASPIILYIRELVATGEWTGTASELLTEINRRADDTTKRLPSWPKAAKTLGGQLRRLAPNLRATGMEVTELQRESGRRPWRLRGGTEVASLASPGSLTDGDDDGDGPPPDDQPASPLASPRRPPRSWAADDGDGSDGPEGYPSPGRS